MQNIKKTQTITLAYLGAILSLIGVLIFNILPTSDFANSIDRSGKDAVYLLTASPILVFIGAVVFMLAFLKDYKIWNSFLSGAMVKGATIFFAVALIYNFAVTLSFFISQFSLGFVASFDGFVYEGLAIVTIVIAILQVVFATLASAAILRNSK